jgi:hypothetical protein
MSLFIDGKRRRVGPDYAMTSLQHHNSNNLTRRYFIKVSPYPLDGSTCFFIHLVNVWWEKIYGK